MAQPGVPSRATQASRARDANPAATIATAARNLRATNPNKPIAKPAKRSTPKPKPVPSTYLGAATL